MTTSWMQFHLKERLAQAEDELLQMVMGFVDRAENHKISEHIEQELTDIMKLIEKLAIDIEDGKWEKNETTDSK